MNKRMALVGALAALVLSGCASLSGPKSIADVAASNPELSTLNQLINDAGLADTLRGAGPYTVFAPTNEAFKAVPAKTLDTLSKDKEALKSVLSYHVLPGAVTSADIKPGNLKTLQGANVAVSKAGTMVTIEDAVVVQADVAASNGVVQVVDRVLMPPKK
ncbi:fasciclin domain-containing protein [Caldimonas sp. KR1-144]|uniref:fasciclin domain-containing protein n=1 Tax=Caldimonas sp. KR1-144 TaxID=3400911 RepID=UPI003C097113